MRPRQRIGLGESRITAKSTPRTTPTTMATKVSSRVFSTPLTTGLESSTRQPPAETWIRGDVVDEHRRQHEHDRSCGPPPRMAQGHGPDLLRAASLDAVDCHRLTSGREPSVRSNDGRLLDGAGLHSPLVEDLGVDTVFDKHLDSGRVAMSSFEDFTKANP